MYNRHVKFDRKIPNRLGKMPENLGGGDFLTHTVGELLCLVDVCCHSNASTFIVR